MGKTKQSVAVPFGRLDEMQERLTLQRNEVNKTYKTRRKIENSIEKQILVVKALEEKLALEKTALFNLKIAEAMFCDSKKNFTIEVAHDGDGGVDLLGNIRYKEDFLDEDTGKCFEIERKNLVYKNGRWYL